MKQIKNLILRLLNYWYRHRPEGVRFAVYDTITHAYSIGKLSEILKRRAILDIYKFKR